MKHLTTAGRVLFALPFLMFGFGHLSNAAAMQGMVPGWLPGGIFWIYFTGVILLAFAISLISGKFTQYTGPGIFLLMLTFVLTIHLPGMSNPDEQIQMMSFSGMMKDLGLAGGGLVIGNLNRVISSKPNPA